MYQKILIFAIFLAVNIILFFPVNAFAATYVAGCIDDSIHNCVPPDNSNNNGGEYWCAQPPYNESTEFSRYKLGFSLGDGSIHDSTTTGTGLCLGSLQPHSNIANDPDYDGETQVFLTLYSPNTSTIYGYTVFELIEGDGTNIGDWQVIQNEEFITLTRIVSFIPPLDSTVATGTRTVGFNYYLNSNDWDGQPAHLEYRLFATGGLNSSAGSVSVYDYPVTTFGSGTFSTSTELTQVGSYAVIAKLFYSPICIFGFCAFYEQISDSGGFNVAYEDGLTGLFGQIIDEIQAGLASTTLNIGNTCSPLNSQFSMSLCVLSLILPPTEVIQSNITNLRSQAPWGYLFRAYDIFSGNATSTASTTLPSISYTTASTSMFGVATFSFDPFGTLSSSTNILNTAVSDQSVQKNVWEIMNPIINIIVFMMLGFMIIRDLTKLRQ